MLLPNALLPQLSWELTPTNWNTPETPGFELTMRLCSEAGPNIDLASFYTFMLRCDYHPDFTIRYLILQNPDDRWMAQLRYYQRTVTIRESITQEVIERELEWALHPAEHARQALAYHWANFLLIRNSGLERQLDVHTHQTNWLYRALMQQRADNALLSEQLADIRQHLHEHARNEAEQLDVEQMIQAHHGQVTKRADGRRSKLDYERIEVKGFLKPILDFRPDAFADERDDSF